MLRSNMGCQDQVQGQRNWLLARLEGRGFKATKGLKRVSLTLHQVLELPGHLSPYVYFPESAIVSLIASTGDTRSLQVAMVGYEGVICAANLLRGTVSPYKAIVVLPGTALRLEAEDLHASMDAYHSLALVLDQYIHSLIVQIGHTALAVNYAAVEECLVRAILMLQDRARTDNLTITHRLLASLLGVHRPAVTLALQRLADRHLVRASRNRIVVMHREELISASNGFYIPMAPE